MKPRLSPKGPRKNSQRFCKGGFESRIFQPPYVPRLPHSVPQLEPGAEAAPSLSGGRGPTQSCEVTTMCPPQPDTTVTLPMWLARLVGKEGIQPFHYWPLVTTDLYNWKAQNALFSEDLEDLTNLLETALFTLHPTWDNCQQILGILFTMKEQRWIQENALKLVLGPAGPTLTDPAKGDVYSLWMPQLGL